MESDAGSPCGSAPVAHAFSPAIGRAVSPRVIFCFLTSENLLRTIKLRALYDGVTAFTGVYSAIWSGCTRSYTVQCEFSNRHQLLVRQLADCLAPALARFHAEDTGELPAVLAKNLLIQAGNSRMDFESFLRIVQRIVS